MSFYLKKPSLVVLKDVRDLQNQCKDKVGILIGIGSLNCEKNMSLRFIVTVFTKWVALKGRYFFVFIHV